MIKTVTHKPVMFKEAIEHLNLKANATVLDCTVGTGGHAQEILEIIGPKGKFIGIDRDEDSLEIAQERLHDYKGAYELIKADFRDIDTVLANKSIQHVDGVLFDLGISSYQLENAERGFSFMREGPLDMRMDRESYISAYDLINSLSENELSGILKTFGQERWHTRIAKFLIRERNANPISTTKQLSNVVMKAIPRGSGLQRIHPATRTFMAFRIAVNRELEALELALEKGVGLLKDSARIVVISFHSLEDRIVKEKFRACAKEKELRIITKKPLRPTQEEMHTNVRSRSAKLRAAERL
ncbi:16S rRNA (cytosine(1402)-N(4))-methyltransferase RsmH [Candidatus Omnitrophota bacterium]